MTEKEIHEEALSLIKQLVAHTDFENFYQGEEDDRQNVYDEVYEIMQNLGIDNIKET